MFNKIPMRTLILGFLFSAAAFAQLPAASQLPLPRWQPLDNSGRTVPGGKICTYATGTFTPQATYTSVAGNVQNSNPIILDSAGRANVWFGNTNVYRVVFQQPGDNYCPGTGASIWTQDGVSSYLQVLSAPSGAQVIGFEPTGGNVPTTVAGALNSAFLYDIGYSSITGACSAASVAGKTLMLTKIWSGLTTQTLACNIQGATGGMIKPASGQTVTMVVLAAPLSTICDTSAGGNCTITSATGIVYPQWWGADDTGVHDATAAIQSAVTALTAVGGGTLSFPVGSYLTGPITMASNISFECAPGTTLLASGNSQIMFNIGNNVNHAGIVGQAGYCFISGNGHTNFQAIQENINGGASSTSNTFRNIEVDEAAIGIDTQNSYFDLIENFRVFLPTVAGFQFEVSTTALNCINCTVISTLTPPALAYCFLIHNGGSININGTCEGTVTTAIYQMDDLTYKVYHENTGSTNTGAWVTVGTQTGTYTQAINLSGSTFSVGAQYGVDLEQVQGLVINGSAFGTTLGAVYVDNSGYSTTFATFRDLDISGNNYNINGGGFDPTKIFIYAGAAGSDSSNNVGRYSASPYVMMPVTPGSTVVPPPAALSNCMGQQWIDGANGYQTYDFKDCSGTLRRNIRVTDLTLSAVDVWPNIVTPGAGSAPNAIVSTLNNALGNPIPVVAGTLIWLHLTGGETFQAGANTLNLNGSGAIAVVANTNQANIPVAYATGAYVQLIYNGTYWADLRQ